MSEDGRVKRGQITREQRREQILRAALEVFAAQGYHATSVSDLVAATGVARGTFYLYFDSKEALFLDLLDDLIAQLSSSIRGVDPSAPVRDQLPAVIARVLRTVDANRALTRILFREAIGLDEAVDARLTAFNDRLHAYVSAALAGGQAMGVVRAGVDVDVAATCVVGGIRYAVQREIVGAQGSLDVDRLARGIVALYLDGLSG